MRFHDVPRILGSIGVALCHAVFVSADCKGRANCELKINNSSIALSIIDFPFTLVAISRLQ